MNVKNIKKAQELKKELDKVEFLLESFDENAMVRKIKFKVRADWSILAKWSQTKFKSEEFENFLNLNVVIKEAIVTSLEKERSKLISQIDEL